MLIGRTVPDATSYAPELIADALDAADLALQYAGNTPQVPPGDVYGTLSEFAFEPLALDAEYVGLPSIPLVTTQSFIKLIMPNRRSCPVP